MSLTVFASPCRQSWDIDRDNIDTAKQDQALLGLFSQKKWYRFDCKYDKDSRLLDEALLG